MGSIVVRTAAVILLAGAATGLFADDETPAAAERPPVIVHLADGTSQPLRAWTLVYEFVAWRQGQPQLIAQPTLRPADALWMGKKMFPVAGSTLELTYGEAHREIDMDGRVQAVLVPVAQKVTLRNAAGKKTELKVEAPHRDLLLPGAEKSMNLLVRSLDLTGETFSGTKRTFCVMSYTSLVECGANSSAQIVKLEFQQ